MREGGAYRDLGAGLRARLAALGDDVDARLSRLPPAVWPRLPRLTSLTLGALHAEVPPTPPDDVDAAARLAVVLERLRDALDAAIVEAAELEPRLLSLPDVSPPLAPTLRLDRVTTAFFDLSRSFVSLGLPSWAQTTEETQLAFAAIVTRRFPEANLERLAVHATRATFRTQGAPLTLLCEVRPRGLLGGGIELRAATGVPLALPRVALLPEVEAGLDVEVGDPDFDGLFDVHAHADDARAVLVPEVRTALVRLAWHDVPRVRIGDGHAEIAWTYEPTREAFDEAARALLALRRVEIATRLLAW